MVFAVDRRITRRTTKMNTLYIDLHTMMMIMQFGNNDMVVHTQLANLFDVYGTDAKMLSLACA